MLAATWTVNPESRGSNHDWRRRTHNRNQISQSEASALLDRLLPALTHEPGDTHNLPEMVERLSDSLWLSGWAKNNVTIELEPKERLELSQRSQPRLRSVKLDTRNLSRWNRSSTGSPASQQTNLDSAGRADGTPVQPQDTKGTGSRMSTSRTTRDSLNDRNGNPPAAVCSPNSTESYELPAYQNPVFHDTGWSTSAARSEPGIWGSLT